MAPKPRPDRDSQLGGARFLNPSNRSTLNPKNDRDDLYRFNLSGRSSVQLALTGLARRTNADIELYRLIRPINEAIGSIGKISFNRLKASQRSSNFALVAASKQGGNRSELINTELDAGDYFVRVSYRQGRPQANIRYQLGFAQTPVALPPVETPPVETPPTLPPPIETPPTTPPPTGTPQPSILPIAIPTTALPGNVNPNQPQTVYSFNVGTDSDYEFNLAGLSGDANLQLVRANGTVVRTSQNSGTNPEYFIQNLDPGAYLLRVVQAAPTVNTNYQLTVSALTDAAGDTQNTATPVSLPINNTIRRRSYVAAGTNSPADYYEFTTPADQDQFITADLFGLSDNLDIKLYEKPSASNPNPEGSSSEELGAAAEALGGTLLRNRTYIIEITPGAENAGTGTTYTLDLRLSPTQSRPSIARDIAPGDRSPNISNLTAGGGRAFFSVGGNALWVSDGTLNGTLRLRTFSEIGRGASVGGVYYFTANDGVSGKELWRSDGTASGTRQLTDFRSGIDDFDPKQFTVVGNRLYFLGQVRRNGEELQDLFYVSDDPTEPIKPVITASSNAGVQGNSIANLTAAGNTLYFTGESGTGNSATGTELMLIRDAANATTIQTIDAIRPGTQSSNPVSLTAVGNSLFFRASTPINGISQAELFRFTPGAGTSFTLDLFDVPPNDFASNPANLFDVNGTLYFVANGGSPTSSGRELWAIPSAETAPNTQAPVLVRDINPGPNPSDPSDFVNLNGALYFLADDGSGRSLWRATNAGGALAAEKVSVVVPRLANVTISDTPNFNDLIVVGQGSSARLYFAGTTTTAGTPPTSDTELWFTDGTNTLSTGVFNINQRGSSNPQQMTDINGRLFLVAATSTSGQELWSFQGLPVAQS